jgi:hypothetical protein
MGAFAHPTQLFLVVIARSEATKQSILSLFAAYELLR